MPTLYADENVPLQVVEALCRLGLDVLTAREAGQANQAISDAEVLAFGAALGRALITLNRRDFIALHRQRPNHAGIVVCSQDPDAEGQARRIAEAIVGAGDLVRALVRVNLPAK